MQSRFLSLSIIMLLLSGCWQEMTLYSIRLQGDDWQRLEIRQPLQVDHDYSSSKYDVKIPHHYKLERKKYVIDISVKPNEHDWQTNLQILMTNKLDTRILSVESSWAGNCGIVGQTSAAGEWSNRPDKLKSVGHPFFTDAKTTGFLWYPGTNYCKNGISQTAEHASKYPITLKIYHDADLIGEEQINFEIFKNGIRKYIVMP